MIYRYTASTHQELVRAFIREINRHTPPHPFRPITILVPNMDMARWLQLQIADASGISANLRFMLPAAWLREQFEALEPAARRSLLDKSQLQWMLYTLLDEDDGTRAWSHLNGWVDRIARRAGGDTGGELHQRDYASGGAGGDTGGELHQRDPHSAAVGSGDAAPQDTSAPERVSKAPGTDGRVSGGFSAAVSRARWDIASQIADAFDQYIMYRPEWLLSWEGTLVQNDVTGKQPDPREVRWQSALWKELVNRWPQIPNRAGLWYRFMQESGGSAGESNTAVFALGLAALPLPVMKAIARHARRNEWYWFLQRHAVAPDSYFAGLDLYSRQQEEAFREVVEEEGVDAGVTRCDADVKPAPPRNNLQRVQGVAAGGPALPLDEADTGSIRIHVCHSARREVEVLHDYLLDLFETTEVRPGDVAVVTPDPDAYRPFVEEVFPASRQPMALHVAGARRGVGEAGTDVMLRSLNLVGTRYKVPDVLDWLETGPVLGDLTDRTGLRHTLHNWVMRQRIRWGIDPGQLQRAGFPLSGRHTWQHGIDRLLLSWLAAEGEDVVVGDLLTGSTVAGQETGALLGRLATVINALASLQHHSETPHTIPRWCDILSDFATQIFTESEDGRQYAGPFRAALLSLQEQAAQLNLTAPVSFPVLRSYLSGILDTTGLGRAWNPGTITFTGMVALHQLPFRVVAILGLNDGKLPGKTPVSAFDLIPQSPRPGDRSRRDADRQLFLDYLLTPDTRLHLSYTGMRQKDNKELAPSVMLTMLEDLLAEQFPREQTSFITKLKTVHALQPFSPKYFREPASPRFSYSRKYRDLAAESGRSRRARKPLFETWRSDITPPTELTLTDLQQFFRDPVKSLLRMQPGIQLDDADVPGESAEPFDFDHLTGWTVRTQLMRTWAESGELAYADLQTYLRRDGLLAEGQAGKRQMNRLIAEIKAFAGYIQEKIGERPTLTPLEVDATVRSASGTTYRIAAAFPYVHELTAWTFEAGKGDTGVAEYKVFRAWLQHLVLNLQHHMVSRSVFRDIREFAFRPLTPQEASSRLTDIMTFFEEGYRRPIPFFPACMKLYLNHIRDGISPEIALQQIEEELTVTDHFKVPEHVRETNTTWIAEAFGDESPVLQDASKTLCTPELVREPLQPADLDQYQLFSLMASRVTDVMHRDLLDKTELAAL